MKSIVFAATLLVSSFAFAGQRVFDCSATQLSNNPEISEDLNIKNNPTVLLIEGKDRWSLNVGDVSLNSLDNNGPALWKEAVSESATVVRYDFWVEASYEFELAISVVDHSAKLYWWGLGERLHVGDFACEVSVK